MRFDPRNLGPLRLVALAALLSAWLCAPLLAGEKAEDDKPVVRPDENTIYIPYKDLEKVFEKSGRGVFLPYEKFLELWRKSRPPVLDTHEEPPLPAAITAASYEGRVEENIAAFKASFQVEVFKEGWTEVPFPFGNLGLSEVKTAEEGAVLAPGKKGEYRLVVKAPGTYHLEVTFAVRVDSKEGESVFNFQTPAASLARFSVVLPGHNLKIDLKPNLAASETPAGDSTRVFAFLGPSREVEVRWRAQAERIGKLEPILHPTVLSLVRVEQGVMEVETTVRFSILQAPADRFRFRFPADFLVITREGANLQKADISREGDAKILDVRLHSGAEKEYEFKLRLQKSFTPGKEVPIPVVSTMGVQREEGTIAVDLVPPLKGKVLRREGLSQVDVRDLPKPIASPEIDFGFTYLKQPVALTLEVEKERAEVGSDVRGLVFATDGRIEYKGTLTVSVERTGIFSLHWLAPAGSDEAPWEIQKLYLRRPGDLNYTFKEAGPGLKRVEVAFPAKTEGAFVMHFELRRERKGELVGEFELPWFRVPSAKRDRGWIGVSTKEGYDLRLVGKPKGFEARNAAEIVAQIREQAQLGFVYNLVTLEEKAAPEFQATVEVKKRPSRVSAKVFTLVEVTDAAVNVEHTVRYDIQQAGVRNFTYSLPVWIKPDEGGAGEGKGAKDWELLDPEIPEKKQHVETLDKERGRRVWKVEIQKEKMGTVELSVRYKRALSDLKPGLKFPVAIPDFQVEEVFQATGYVGLKKGDNIVLEPRFDQAGKLFKADLAELEPPLKDKKPFTAFRYTEYPWGLGLDITKYDYEKILPTVVNHMHVDTIVTEEREIRTRLLLLLQNKERQSLRVRFPRGAKITFLSVDGRQQQPSKSGEADETVKLVNLNAVRGREGEFLVKILYDITPERKGMSGLGGGLDIDAPVVLSEQGEGIDPPVALLTMDLFLPADYEYLSFRTESMVRLTRIRGLWERIRDFFLGSRTRIQAADMAAAVDTIHAVGENNKALGEPEYKVAQGKRSFRFFKLSGGGSVGVSYMGPVTFQFINVLLLIAALAAMLFLPYYEIAGKTHLLLSFAVGSLLVSAISEALTPFMGTVFLGTLGAALYWLGHYTWKEIPSIIRAKQPPKPVRPTRGGPAAATPEVAEPPEKTPAEPLEEDDAKSKSPSKRTPKSSSSGRSTKRSSGRASGKKSTGKGSSGRSDKKGRGK